MVATTYNPTDLQRVWKLVQELSTQLRVNQEVTEKIRRQADGIKVRLVRCVA